LREIREWAERPVSPHIFWLSGMAGTGKSTILFTAAKLLEETIIERPSPWSQLLHQKG